MRQQRQETMYAQCPNCGDTVRYARLKAGERLGDRECAACQASTRATRKLMKGTRGPAALARRFA